MCATGAECSLIQLWCIRCPVYGAGVFCCYLCGVCCVHDSATSKHIVDIAGFVVL